LLGVLHNAGSLPGSAGYTYDAAGNRLTKTAVQEASPNPVSVTSNYSYDPIYELTQAAGWRRASADLRFGGDLIRRSIVNTDESTSATTRPYARQQ